MLNFSMHLHIVCVEGLYYYGLPIHHRNIDKEFHKTLSIARNGAILLCVAIKAVAFKDVTPCEMWYTFYRTESDVSEYHHKN